MTRDEAMRLARDVSRECYRRWRVSENWEAVEIDRIVDEFLVAQKYQEAMAAVGRFADAMQVQAQIDAAVRAYRQDMHECEQIAGRALGYPRYADDQQNFPDATDADGVCVGEHVAPTIVAELAEKYHAAMSELVRWRNTAANQMIQEAREKEREAFRKAVETQLNGYYCHQFFEEFDRVEYLHGALQALADNTKADEEPLSMEGVAPGHAWERMPGRGWTLRKIDS